jgi:hypothetical protein
VRNVQQPIFRLEKKWTHKNVSRTDRNMKSSQNSNCEKENERKGVNLLTIKITTIGTKPFWNQRTCSLGSSSQRTDPNWQKQVGGDEEGNGLQHRVWSQNEEQVLEVVC